MARNDGGGSESLGCDDGFRGEVSKHLELYYPLFFRNLCNGDKQSAISTINLFCILNLQIMTGPTNDPENVTQLASESQPSSAVANFEPVATANESGDPSQDQVIPIPGHDSVLERAPAPEPIIYIGPAFESWLQKSILTCGNYSASVWSEDLLISVKS